MMRRAFFATVVVVLAVLSGAGPAVAITTAPAYAGDFPDPSVLVVGGTYWAYSTGSAGRNLQVMSSPDLNTWSAPSDPLPVLPSWASWGLTWAPDVVPRGGGYVMYYTVRDTASGRQCISLASASTPAGPFTDTSAGPLLCQLANGGSIDPSVLVTPAASYLVWKSDDNALGRRTSLWSQQLSTDGRSLVGTRSLLLSADWPWQGGVIEGPTLVQAGGLYHLLYGANAWDSANAAIGHALCLSPLGPCQNLSILGPWMGSQGSRVGPSGPDTFVDAGGVTRLAYHAWTGAAGYQNGGVRSLWVDRLTFLGPLPTLH